MEKLNTYHAPGVYINEVSGFPNSVTGVPTAVPAFIGYTPQAFYQGISYRNVPVLIASFADFKAYFCLPDLPPPAAPTKQYAPQYYLVARPSQPLQGDSILINGTWYSILPDANTIYYLYNSVRLFYENGGGNAYIVSVGDYGTPSHQPMEPGTPMVNTNVQLSELLNGLSVLKNESGPTMYICPEATLLSAPDNATLMQAMLQQCNDIQSAISVFDIIGGNDPDPIHYMEDIAAFRNNTGNQGLSYGTAYYPFVNTTITGNNEIDYTNIMGGNIAALAAIINPSGAPDAGITAVINQIQNPANRFTVYQNNNALLNASKVYVEIMNHVMQQVNTLPASGGMAGVITTTDNSNGPWKAPANASITGVVDLPIRLNDTQQDALNVDAITGKSVNAIRFFNGMGILIWGARTLDGNSQDWRYLPVRRTVIFIEQSCKLAMQSYVFEPNTQNTWVSVKEMINNFLTDIWKLGGLMGTSPAQAFSVQCGLGVTMTAEDILNGVMTVTVCVAMVRPAEFIVFSVSQKMAS